MMTEYGLTPYTSPLLSSLVRRSGAAWVRIPVSWNQLQPGPNHTDFTALRGLVDSLPPDVKVLVTLRAVCEWGTRPARDEDLIRASRPPADLAVYGAFVRRMADAFRGRVAAYQFENEVATPSFWAGTADEYIALLTVAHDSVKFADAGAMVVCGSLTGGLIHAVELFHNGWTLEQIVKVLRFTEPLSSLRALFERGLLFLHTMLGRPDLFDAMDLHVSSKVDYTDIPIEGLRGLMAGAGYSRPVWVTEIAGPNPRFTPSWTPEEHAQEVRDRLALAILAGASKAFWFSLTDVPSAGILSHTGLADENLEPRPAFHAYRKIARWGLLRPGGEPVGP